MDFNNNETVVSEENTEDKMSLSEVVESVMIGNVIGILIALLILL